MSLPSFPPFPSAPPFLPGLGAALLRALDRELPLSAKQLAVEPVLNRLFAGAIAGEEFDLFEGRTLRLQVPEAGWGVTLGFWMKRFRVLEDAAAEVTISGSWQAFAILARKREDPDALFFRRELTIEGDTELGLALKNRLDALDWSPWG